MFSVCAFAQSDVNYRALRDGAPSENLRAENIELKRDKGSLTLKNGQLSFLAPVLGRPEVAVFTGDGVFRLKPATLIEAQHLARVIGRADIEEAFDSAVLFFTDATYAEVKGQASAMPADPKAVQVLKNVRDKLRHDMTFGDIGNVEAELLGELYNPKRGASFRAYLHGKKYGDLRFFTAPSGALPEVMSPEEVAVVNVDSSGEHAGIWYLAHFANENAVNSAEEKRDIRSTHYRIDRSHHWFCARSRSRAWKVRSHDSILR